jgi:two-component sensor histidine kinase
MQSLLKTTLQLATSLFNLQRAQHRDSHLTAAFAASAQRLQVLALSHEAIAQESSATYIDGAAYLRKLQATVIRTMRVDPQRITLIMDLSPVPLPFAQVVPCGLILNELLTNAIQHAFPESCSGLVSVELHALPGTRARLQVSDTGIGVPTTLDIHHPKRLGWQLVTLLTQQLHGVLTLEQNHGTCVTVQWPRRRSPAA